MKKIYDFEGHKIAISINPSAVERVHCNTCSVPLTIAEAIVFMSLNSVNTLIIDGQTIKFFCIAGDDNGFLTN